MGNKLRKRKPVVQEIETRSPETRSPSTASTSVGDGDLSPAGVVGCCTPMGVNSVCSAPASQSDGLVARPWSTPRYNYKS